MADNKKELLRKVIQLIKENNWEEAHQIVQEYEGDYQFDSLHALLHRQEGDLVNTRWWYRQLNKSVPQISIEEELHILEKTLL